MKIKNLALTAMIVAAGLFVRPASAQLDLSQISGTNYSQNFDGIGGGLPTGWNTYSTASSTAVGSLSAFHTATTPWNNVSTLFWNFASLTNNDGSVLASNATTIVQAAVTNRVVGIRQTGTANTGGDPGAAIALELLDTTNGSNFQLSFDWLQLNSQTRTTVWNVDYGIGSNPTLFTKLGTWTSGGFYPSQTNLSYFGTTNLSFSLGTALDNQSQPVWIRITALSATTGSGSRCSFGLDNFNLSWSPPNTTTNPPTISSQPQSVTGDAKATVMLSVGAGNTTSPVYQWYEIVSGVTNQLSDGGSPSGDGSSIAGSTGPTLNISGVLGAEAGKYFVNISNGLGATNSAVATLTVNDPVITAQPGNMTNVLNDVDFFAATAVGSQPQSLFWYYNSTLVTNLDFNTTSNSLTIFVPNTPAATNLPGYFLVASNQFGMMTSAVATATIFVTPSVEITRWDFNAPDTYTATNPTASIGTGLATPAPNPAVTNFAFANGALFDPNQLVAGSVNDAMALNGFQAGITNKTAGFQYNTSLTGYKNILLTWAERHSDTASKYMRVQYSTNGVDFIDGDVETFNFAAYQFYSSNLGTNPGVANNPNFAFRVVAEWESSAIGTVNSNYVATTAGSSFGSGGTIREDLMTVFGDPLSLVVPIPLHIKMAGTNVVLTWNDASSAFSLQSAPLVNGTYNTVSGATSPYTNAITGAQQFFRLKSN